MAAKRTPVVGIHEQDFLPWWCVTMLWHFTLMARKVWILTVVTLTWIFLYFGIAGNQFAYMLCFYIILLKLLENGHSLKKKDIICCRSFIFLSNFHGLSLAVHILVRAELQKSREVNAAGVTVAISPNFESYWRSSETKTSTLAVLLRED